jgi:hypothetical protein
MTTTSPVRTLEDIHRDVGFATTFRLEFIKQLLMLAGAVFVFTISFVKDWHQHPTHTSLVGIAWFSLALSLLGGLGHLAGWDRYYIRTRQ